MTALTPDHGLEPLENGLDYLQSVVGHLGGTLAGRELKYAVLHLQASVEVLLKVRLAREHWTLVVKYPDKVTHEKYLNGDFESISLDDTLTRLAGIANVVVAPRLKQSLRN